MIFGVFERVLAELDSSGEDAFGDDWPGELATAFQSLSEYYGNQNLRNPDRDLIDYSGLPTQAAYIFMYAIGRAEFSYQLLKRFRAALGRPLFDRESINVTSVGGGPASELVGLIRYLEEPGNGEVVTEILYDVIDKEGDWNDLANLVVGAIQSEIDVTVRFYQADLANADGIGQLTLEFDDLVMMSFFVSEICELPNSKAVKDNIDSLMDTMKTGGKLFYNDSDAYSFYSYMNARARSIKGLVELHEVQDVIVFDYADPGEKFLEYAESFDRVPHLSSKAVSKIYERK